MPDLLSPIVLQGLGLVAAATLVLCGRVSEADRARGGTAPPSRSTADVPPAASATAARP